MKYVFSYPIKLLFMCCKCNFESFTLSRCQLASQISWLILHWFCIKADRKNCFPWELECAISIYRSLNEKLIFIIIYISGIRITISWYFTLLISSLLSAFFIYLLLSIFKTMPKLFTTSINSTVFYLKKVLDLSGDIEVNPDPKETFFY